MNATARTATPSRKSHGWWEVAAVLLFFGAASGYLPSPFAGFFEESAGIYHAVDVVLAESKSPRLQYAVKDALDRDGKLTQSNMTTVWRAYEDAIPIGSTLPIRGEADIGTERAKLIQAVGATPARTVLTFW